MEGEMVMGKTQGFDVIGLALNPCSAIFWQIQEIAYIAWAPVSFSMK